MKSSKFVNDAEYMDFVESKMEQRKARKEKEMQRRGQRRDKRTAGEVAW